jgi:hypothetical protein
MIESISSNFNIKKSAIPAIEKSMPATQAIEQYMPPTQGRSTNESHNNHEEFIDIIQESIIFKCIQFIKFSIVTFVGEISSSTRSLSCTTFTWLQYIWDTWGIKVMTDEGFDNIDTETMIDGMAVINTTLTAVFGSVADNWNNYIVIPSMGIFSVKFLVIMVGIALMYTLYSLLKISITILIIIKLYSIVGSTSSTQETSVTKEIKQI